MEDLGLPELTSQQIEELCEIAEEAARKHVHSKVARKNIEALNIIAEAEGEKPVSLTVDVDVSLSPSAKNVDAERLAEEAVRQAFKSAEKYLREIACRSRT